MDVLEQGQYAFNKLYQEVSNPSESFDEIVKYEVKEIKESLAKFQQLLRSSKVEPMNEDEGADALIDQIYRMIEAGDAERARALLNRNRKAIAKSYPGALRELESLINDNL